MTIVLSVPCHWCDRSRTSVIPGLTLTLMKQTPDPLPPVLAVNGEPLLDNGQVRGIGESRQVSVKAITSQFNATLKYPAPEFIQLIIQ